MQNRKSIVLVTVDCLRADHVGFMGYARPTTPFLDGLAAESFIVPTAIAAGAPTYYSFPAILGARYPLALGRDVLGLGPDEPTLASVLRQAGYRTASFGAGNPYISARFGYAQGFEIFRDFLENDVTPFDGAAATPSNKAWGSKLNRNVQKIRPRLGRAGIFYDELYFQYCQRSTPVPDSLDALRRFPSADVIVDSACEWLSSVGTAPFFLWLHLMDPHSPYYPKNEALAWMGNRPFTPFRARYVNSSWNRSDLGTWRLRGYAEDIVRLYDAGIRWADEQLGRLAYFLRTNHRWDECILAVTADHGEEFLDHGGRYHPPSRLMEELIHVPFLLRVPGAMKNSVNRSPFSLISVSPTLLDAAQLDLPPDFRQYSRWNQMQDGGKFDDAAISESISNCTNPFRPENRLGLRVLSIRESRFKLILNFEQPADYLYDLEADPGEQAPLASGSQLPVRRRLLEIAREHLRRSRENRDVPTRVRARLRDLQLEWANPQTENVRAVC
jgi:arylsulfatase A-like enzyme